MHSNSGRFGGMALIPQSWSSFMGKTSYSRLFWSSSSNSGITLKTSATVQLGVRRKGNIVTARLEPGEGFRGANREKLEKKVTKEQPKREVLEDNTSSSGEVTNAEVEESSSKALELDVENLLETLLMEANHEYDRTLKIHELEGKALKLREEFSEVKSLDQCRDIVKKLSKVVSAIKEERADFYEVLKKKRDLLEQLENSRALEKTGTENVSETGYRVIEEEKVTPSLPTDSEMEAMKEMLQKEADREYDKAVKALGFENEVLRIHKEFSEAKSLGQRLAVMDSLEKVEEKINEVLFAAPNYKVWKKKNQMVEEIEKALQLRFEESLKKELQTNVKQILERPGMETEYEELLTKIMNSKAESSADLDESIKTRITKWKKEIESSVLEVLKTKALLSNEVREEKAKALSETILYGRFFEDEVSKVAKEVVMTISSTGNSPELQPMIKLLEMEKKMYKKSPDPESRRRIEELDRKIEEMGMTMVNYPEDT